MPTGHFVSFFYCLFAIFEMQLIVYIGIQNKAKEHRVKDEAFNKIKDNLQRFNRPIYEVIIETIYSMIESGELPAGTKFPPDKKLALELGINHITLAKALNELRRRNVLERRRASGTSVPLRQLSPQNGVTKRTIAVVFDDANERTFQQRLFLQLHKGLESLGCTMNFYSSGGKAEQQLALLKQIAEDYSICGCIVWSLLSTQQAAEICHCLPPRYPLIFLDCCYPDLNCDAVTFNNVSCAKAVARALIRRNIHHIFWIEREQDTDRSTIRERREAIRSSCGENVEFTVLSMKEAISAQREYPSDSALVILAFDLALEFDRLAVRKPPLGQMVTFATDYDDLSLLPNFTIYKFEAELGTEAVKILASRLNGKESCTVNHSGKWSVLGAKKNRQTTLRMT